MGLFMKKKRYFLQRIVIMALLMALLMAFLTGCGKKPPAQNDPVQNDPVQQIDLAGSATSLESQQIDLAGDASSVENQQIDLAGDASSTEISVDGAENSGSDTAGTGESVAEAGDSSTDAGDGASINGRSYLPDEDGVYTTKEDVGLYIETYGHLPSNFITKKEAKALGWSGGSLEEVAPGKCIGGDRFGNYEGLLPEGEYYECDIDTLGQKKRGTKRLVFNKDRFVYYTEDHYETFELLFAPQD